MAKQIVTIIDSAGQIHERKLSWVLRKAEQKLCSLDCAGRWVFRAHNQAHVGAGPLSLRGGKARVSDGVNDRRTPFVPPMTDGYSGMNFLPYPLPSKVTGSSLRPSLRSQFRALQREGAGLGA